MVSFSHTRGGGRFRALSLPTPREAEAPPVESGFALFIDREGRVARRIPDGRPLFYHTAKNIPLGSCSPQKISFSRWRGRCWFKRQVVFFCKKMEVFFYWPPKYYPRGGWRPFGGWWVVLYFWEGYDIVLLSEVFTTGVMCFRKFQQSQYYTNKIETKYTKYGSKMLFEQFKHLLHKQNRRRRNHALLFKRVAFVLSLKRADENTFVKLSARECPINSTLSFRGIILVYFFLKHCGCKVFFRTKVSKMSLKSIETRNKFILLHLGSLIFRFASGILFPPLTERGARGRAFLPQKSFCPSRRNESRPPTLLPDSRPTILPTLSHFFRSLRRRRYMPCPEQ